MAYLFGVLLGFSRLSADGEFTALLASGYSLARASVPILAVGALLYVIAAFCALNLEPWGRRELIDFYHRKAETELDNILKYKLQSGVFLDDFLGFVLYAETVSADRTHFDHVMLAPGRNRRKGQNFTLFAPAGAISGSVETGDLKMSFDYGTIYSSRTDGDQAAVMKFKHMEIDILRIFQEQIFGSGDNSGDYRSFGPVGLWNYIDKAKEKAGNSRKDALHYYKARFLFHQRAGLPFAAVTFAMFAMVLGIQDQRKGRSSAYIGAIFAIIGGYVFMMGFKWLAERGSLSAPLAAWAPNLLLFLFGAFLLYQKNRLPSSEPTLDPRNIPFVNRFVSKV